MLVASRGEPEDLRLQSRSWNSCCSLGSAKITLNTGINCSCWGTSFLFRNHKSCSDSSKAYFPLGAIYSRWWVSLQHGNVVDRFCTWCWFHQNLDQVSPAPSVPSLKLICSACAVMQGHIGLWSKFRHLALPFCQQKIAIYRSFRNSF